MIFYQQLEVSVLMLITLIYAVFDVFNKRNVPNLFVYATIVVGVVVALVANSGLALITSFLVAGVLGLLGYLIYRAGLLGAGDVLEFVFIALVMPVQMAPFLNNIYQWNIPFVLSVIIAAGYTSLIFIPIYYLLVKKRPGKAERPSWNRIATGIAFFAAYMIFLAVIKYAYGVDLFGAMLIFVLALASGITLIYEQRIYLGMVEFIYPKELEEGDMIATNLMSKKDLAFFKKKGGFGRLASAKLITKIRKVARRLPVYRDSVPFSLFIFIGTIISLLFGNLILAMIGL